MPTGPRSNPTLSCSPPETLSLFHRPHAVSLVPVERAVHHERPRREPEALEEVLRRPVARQGEGVDAGATARRAERDEIVGHGLPHADLASVGLDEEVADDAERLARPEALERDHTEADDGLLHRAD